MQGPPPKRLAGDKISKVLKSAQTKILWIGSGDGSQPAAVVRSGHTNNVVSFYDSRASILAKYPTASEELKYLDAMKIEQHFSVDVNLLGEGEGPLGNSATHEKKNFDVIVFYFPHVGGDNGSPSTLIANRELIRSYLHGALRLLAPDGEIHLATKVGGTYEKWDVTGLIEENAKLVLVQQKDLDKSQFPGYVHRLTVGSHGKLSEVKDCGAQVYVMKEKIGSAHSATDEQEAESTIEDMIFELNARIVVNLGPRTLVSMTDVEVEKEMNVAFEASSRRPLTVLEVRRIIGAAVDPSLLPDTRQCNRVLYAMEAKGILVRKMPKKGSASKKPTWAWSK